jgi:hypothetical protein
MHQGDPRVKQIIGEAALAQATGSDRHELQRRLLASRSAALAELSLWGLLTAGPDRDAVAREALLDRRPRLRFLAQHHLRAIGVDIPAFYRDLLHRDPIPALRGLGDCGSSSDADLAASFVTVDDPLVRRAAVDAIGRLNAVAYADRLIECLRDDAIGVAITAGRSLSRTALPLSATDAIWEVMNSDGRPHVVYASSRAARGLPRWSRLRVGLRSVSTLTPALQDRGIETIDQVIASWNQSYLRPTPDEADEITALIDLTCRELGNERCDALALLVADYGLNPRRASDLKEAAAETVKDRPDSTRGLRQRLRQWAQTSRRD